MKISTARRCVLPVLGAVAVMGASAAVFADDPIPKPFPVAHFEKLAAHSPFSPPTAPPAATPPPAPTPPPSNFADKYTLAAIMQQGSDYVATLNNKDTSEHIRVNLQGEPNQGLNISSVEWASEPTQTKVTLVKDKGSGAPEFGTVEFDASQSPTTAGVPGVPAASGVPRPNFRPVPPIPGGVIRPPPGVMSNRIIPGAIPNNQPIRRPDIIRAPTAVTTPRANLPGVNFNSAPQPPGKVPGSDDDDDDDSSSDQ